MSSLINNAMSGLSAAQAALNTASNNISSYNVAGYTRQTTIMAQANSTLGAGGWVGNGVYVSGVQREYDAFITNQLRAAQTQSSGLTTRYEQMSKIDNLLSSETNNVSTSLQGFFTSLQTLVSNAEDPAARQALIGKADGLVNQFKTTDQYLRDQDKQVNIAIGASVDQINNYAKQIASLNDQISRLTGVGAGASPNDCWINAINWGASSTKLLVLKSVFRMVVLITSPWLTAIRWYRVAAHGNWLRCLLMLILLV